MNYAAARTFRQCAARQPTARVRGFTSCHQWLLQPQQAHETIAAPIPEQRQSGFNMQFSAGKRIPIRSAAPVKRESIDSAKPDERFLSLQLDKDEIAGFSPQLLRDMCACPACLDPSTKQKLFATPEIPQEIVVRDHNTTESGVRIQWSQDIPGWHPDHVTELSWDVLRNIHRIGFFEPPFSLGPQALWDTATFDQLPDVEYEAYMQDDAVVHKAVYQLHTHGLLFLTNVPESETAVSAIGERIGPIKNTFYGYTWDVRSVPEAKNVAYTSQNLGFHMDLLYMKQPPHIQLLHCIRSSAKGGASQFTDSYRAATELYETDLEAFDTLSRIDVTFHYNHPTSNLYRQQRPVIELHPLKSNGLNFNSIAAYRDHWKKIERRKRPHNSREVEILSLIDAVAWSPPFQGPFQLKTPFVSDTLGPHRGSEWLSKKVNNWHREAQKFNTLIHRPDRVYERMMGPGQCVIFDNRRVLHGRKEFEVGDAGTERWLRGAYLDKDPYMSKLQVLHKRFGELSA